jgi:hypothetical protein
MEYIIRLATSLRGKKGMGYSGFVDNYSAMHQAIIFHISFDFIHPLFAIGIAGIKLSR